MAILMLSASYLLVAEIILVVVLLFVPPKRYSYFFAKCANCIDSIMEIKKYRPMAQSSMMGNINAHSITSAKMNMFRSQRNLYISGLSLFLVLLECSHEATLKQALNTSQQFKKKLEASDEISPEKFNKLELELKALKKDHAAMVTQSEGLKREYDRLLNEYETLDNANVHKDAAAEKKLS